MKKERSSQMCPNKYFNNQKRYINVLENTFSSFKKLLLLESIIQIDKFGVLFQNIQLSKSLHSYTQVILAVRRM